MAYIAGRDSAVRRSAKRGCRGTFDRASWHRLAKVVYSGKRKPSDAQRAKLRLRFRCQARPKVSKPILRRHQRSYRRHHVQRLELIYLIPYDCGTAGRFAIPCYIVNCESRFSWSAFNSIGARGPYQFNGWPVPWPVITAADRVAHHRMAQSLWAGGAGASHWTQCL